MTTAAILPVKRFDQAKQRLGATLPGALRADLARAMVGDVLVALRDVRGLDAIVVVTGEPSVAAAARYIGAAVVDDSDDAGQSAAASAGIGRALADGAARALLVPGDCPALDPAEVGALLARADPAPAVTILPDRHGTGTNGLLMSPPDVIEPSFGPGSLQRHRERAAAAGAAWRVEPLPSLLLDVDTGDDLDALRERLAGQGGGARRTRELLAAAGPPVPAG
jgi:2-phospho-L-lactate guanylyltransferase